MEDTSRELPKNVQKHLEKINLSKIYSDLKDAYRIIPPEHVPTLASILGKLSEHIEKYGDGTRAVALAMMFHEKYERLAPTFGYETKEETKKFDPESKNGKLMIAVCDEILRDWFKE